MTTSISYYPNYNDTVTVDLNREVVPGRSRAAMAVSTVEAAIETLRSQGPFVAEIAEGPAFYSREAAVLSDPPSEVKGEAVYGWPSGSRKQPCSAPSIKILVVGSAQEGDTERVFYVQTDVTGIYRNALYDMQGLSRSSIDGKVYAISYQTFWREVDRLYFPLSESQKIELAEVRELERADWRRFDSSNDGEIGELVKRVGQRIFDAFLAETKSAGCAMLMLQNALAQIGISSPVLLDPNLALWSRSPDVVARQQAIARAWEGVGNDDQRWTCGVRSALIS